MSEQKFITAEGLEKIKQELDERKNTRRKEITHRIEEAIKLGDLSENAEYHEAKDDQGMNEARIRELEEIIKSSEIIKTTDISKNNINLGTKLKATSNGKEYDFTIVGANEANPGEGLISNESPLGKAMIGKKKGDQVEVETPAGKISYKITNIL